MTATHPCAIPTEPVRLTAGEARLLLDCLSARRRASVASMADGTKTPLDHDHLARALDDLTWRLRAAVTACEARS